MAEVCGGERCARHGKWGMPVMAEVCNEKVQVAQQSRVDAIRPGKLYRGPCIVRKAPQKAWNAVLRAFCCAQGAAKGLEAAEAQLEAALEAQLTHKLSGSQRGGNTAGHSSDDDESMDLLDGLHDGVCIRARVCLKKIFPFLALARGS